MMGSLSPHAFSVLFLSQICFLMDNIQLCLLLTSNVSSVEPRAEGLLRPSAAKVESEQEHFKAHVGLRDISFSLGAHHLSTSCVLFPPPAVILPGEQCLLCQLPLALLTRNSNAWGREEESYSVLSLFRALQVLWLPVEVTWEMRMLLSLECNFLAGDHQLSPGSLISALQSSLQCNFVRNWLFSF